MFQVKLAVYDLSRGLASQMSEAILGQRIDGIWHTGKLQYLILCSRLVVGLQFRRQVSLFMGGSTSSAEAYRFV